MHELCIQRPADGIYIMYAATVQHTKRHGHTVSQLISYISVSIMTKLDERQEAMGTVHIYSRLKCHHDKLNQQAKRSSKRRQHVSGTTRQHVIAVKGV